MPKTKAPAQTFKEPECLAELVQRRTPVTVKLIDGQEFDGTIEYWDAPFIRLTRGTGPNLFIYKNNIRYIAMHGEAEPE